MQFTVQKADLLRELQLVQGVVEKKATIAGLCQSRVSLKGAQYRIDVGEWTAIDAMDGIVDSGMEQWQITTDPLKPGEHALEVKCADVAGNVMVANGKIVVP